MRGFVREKTHEERRETGGRTPSNHDGQLRAVSGGFRRRRKEESSCNYLPSNNRITTPSHTGQMTKTPIQRSRSVVVINGNMASSSSSNISPPIERTGACVHINARQMNSTDDREEAFYITEVDHMSRSEAAQQPASHTTILKSIEYNSASLVVTSRAAFSDKLNPAERLNISTPRFLLR
ncbi:hypothetical protein PROFUN_11848 [Planoprotostelium fungivorum]|uniref:Uncharacterized protein n=1 Tax=Planoprotostelium fungivorum TaxID=1890364 RepID=A0A2P6N9B0_9EUKA|nr:hypothetical protein PROFUN_11848 [Planoprotostelium fungivorum]